MLVSSPLSFLELSWTQCSPVSSLIIASTNVPVGHGAAGAVLAPPSSGSAPTLLGDLSLSLYTQPILAKLVNLTRSGQFIEMRDLLGDNIALTQHYESLNNAFPAHVLPASSRPRLREVTLIDLLLHNVPGCMFLGPSYTGWADICQADCSGGIEAWQPGMARL